MPPGCSEYWTGTISYPESYYTQNYFYYEVIL